VRVRLDMDTYIHTYRQTDTYITYIPVRCVMLTDRGSFPPVCLQACTTLPSPPPPHPRPQPAQQYPTTPTRAGLRSTKHSMEVVQVSPGTCWQRGVPGGQRGPETAQYTTLAALRHGQCLPRQHTESASPAATPCGHTDRQTKIHTDRQTKIHTYIHTYIHTKIHTYVHAYIHTYMHTYIHTYIHTRQTDKQTDKQTYMLLCDSQMRAVGYLGVSEPIRVYACLICSTPRSRFTSNARIEVCPTVCCMCVLRCWLNTRRFSSKLSADPSLQYRQQRCK
jgi:hypothetical protein